MKDLSLILWITQLGLRVATPLAGFVLLAVWLRDQRHWGDWVIWAGVILGSGAAVQSLRSSLKMLERLTKDQKKPDKPGGSFHDHD